MAKTIPDPTNVTDPMPVIYGNGHSRPEQCDRHPGAIHVPSEWIRGVLADGVVHSDPERGTGSGRSEITSSGESWAPKDRVPLG
jgi:hypothetical protein